ncbi:glycoside hydrolase [Lutibacter sp. B2]|nr:glycoside hydrolase [Lutibacter sp. B2]
MRKKNMIFTIICSILLSSIIFFYDADKLGIRNEKLTKHEFEKKHMDEELNCLHFIEKKLSSKAGGIHTNYLDTKERTNLASGHEILSESEGLIMLYYVKNNNKALFDQHFEFVRKNMMTKKGGIKWRVREGNNNLTSSAASIDDLRVVHALLEAYTKWKEKEYYELMCKISKYTLKNSTYKEILTNRYEDHDIDLSYIDVYTIKLLEDKKWDKIYNHSLDIIEKGYISDEFPLYKKEYHINTKKYLNTKRINMIDSLLVVLHLSEVGLVKEKTIDWIGNELLNKGKIYSDYDLSTETHSGNGESTAVYSIIARIAKNIGNEALYDKAIRKMINLQVNDPSSKIYGSFGDINTLQVYSFDNLQALLAF